MSTNLRLAADNTLYLVQRGLPFGRCPTVYKSQRRAAVLSAGEARVAAPPVRSVGHPIVTVLPAGFGDDPPSEIMKPNVRAV